MKFQISAQWIWGYQFEIPNDELKLVEAHLRREFITTYAKKNMIHFFRKHNLLDLSDFVQSIKHMCLCGYYNLDDENSANNDEIVYLCYHSGDMDNHFCD
jgi:hypothetical protein